MKGLTTGAHSVGHEGPQEDLARERGGQTGVGQWISSGIVLPPSQGNVAGSADICVVTTWRMQVNTLQHTGQPLTTQNDPG